MWGVKSSGASSDWGTGGCNPQAAAKWLQYTHKIETEDFRMDTVT